jgi:hypothetical protein
MARNHEPGMPPKKSATSGSGKWTKYTPKKTVEQVAWDECNSALIATAVCEVTRGGDALLFGATRDGGALVLTVCSGDERVKFYANAPEEMDTHLENIIATAKSA